VSLIKRFQEDKDDLGEKAAAAAWLDNSTERLNAITAVFQECGERANVYADPMFAARELVKESVFWFRFNRIISAWDKELQSV
jgi:hypothetical protein